ncbi:TolC family protein [bacterium]|nr:TolC family protein [bacterium]
MYKKIFVLTLLISLINIPAFAQDESDIGNKINDKEYPAAEKVLPKEKKDTDTPITISGSVVKNVDMTLEKCIEIALGNNPQINAAFHDALASDARIKQVWSNYFPQLNVQSGYTRIRQLQLSDALRERLTYNYWVLGQVTLQQMLYDFGVTQNQATIKKLDYEAYKASLAGVINDIIYQTKDAYYNLLLSIENKRVAEDNVNKYELFYNQAKAFYKIGMNPKVDVTIAQSNLSNAKLQLIQAENAVNIAIAQLNNIMGVPFIEKYDVSERLEYVPVDITLNKAIDIARDSRPELKVAELKVESSKQVLKLANKAYFPTLSIEGQYQRGGRHPDSNYGYSIGGYLTFPNINVALIRNQMKEARYLYDRELANAQNTQNAIYLEIQTAYLTMAEKKAQIPVAILQVKQAKENYELSYGRYRVGEASPVELRDAQVTYQEAQFAYYNTLYGYNSAKAALEKAIGKNLINCDDPITLKK